MTGCGCIYVGEGDDEYDYDWNDHDAIAGQTFECCECHRDIPLNSTFWRVEVNVFEWDEDSDEDESTYIRTDTYNVCPDCRSVATEFFCDAIPFENFWRYVAEHVDYVGGEISSDCLLRLTPRARGRVVDLIDKAWGLT